MSTFQYTEISLTSAVEASGADDFLLKICNSINKWRAAVRHFNESPSRYEIVRGEPPSYISLKVCVDHYCSEHALDPANGDTQQLRV